MPGPTNPYYQRAFAALAGTLARAISMVNEFALIQRGFDLIGNVSNVTKYQLSCSDLDSELTAVATAAYFRVQRALTAFDVRASVLTVSSAGLVQVAITVNGVNMLTTPLTIDAGEFSSTTAAVPVVLGVTEIPDDAVIVVSIVAPGTGAKGLIVSLIGRITTA